MGSKSKKRLARVGAGPAARVPAVDSQRLQVRVKRIAWVLGLVTLAVYLRVTGHAFLSYDDAVYVTDNAYVLRGLAPSSIAWAFTATEGSNYWHPLTWLSHMLDVDLYGLRAGGHHFTSALLHAVNTGLLFVIGYQLSVIGYRLSEGTKHAPVADKRSENRDFPSLWPPFLIAGLFGLHPLHVESVAWVAGRKDVLSGLFWILAIGAYARYARAARETGNWKLGGSKAGSASLTAPRFEFPVSSFRWYVLTLFLFAFSLMSKPMAVTLPFVLLLLDWWPLQRCAVSGVGGPDGDAGSLKPETRDLKTLVLEKVPFFALAAAVSFWVYRTQQAGGALAAGAGIPLDYRLANAVLSYVAYLGQTVWPAKLAFFYPHPEADLSFWAAGGAGVMLAAVTGVAIWQRQRRPWLLVGWLWYVITLLPVSGLIQVGSFARADRYTYLGGGGGGRGRDTGNWKLETGEGGRRASVAAPFQVSSIKFRVARGFGSSHLAADWILEGWDHAGDACVAGDGRQYDGDELSG